MGSIISKLYDDYDDYVNFCRMVNEKPISMGDHRMSFYKHQKLLLEKHDYVKDGSWFRKNISTNN